MSCVTKVEPKNPLQPKRVDIQDARSGNMAEDGYEVLDRAGRNDGDYPMAASEKARRGLSERVYLGPQQTPDDY